MAAFRVITNGLARVRLSFCLIAFCGLSITLASSKETGAAELEKPFSSVTKSGLAIAPSDTDIYVGGMNLATQWERFQATQFYYDVSQNRLVQAIVKRTKGEWDAREGQMGQIRSTIQNPNVMSLLEMGADMISDEFFIFADGRLSELSFQISELADEITSIATEEENADENLQEFFMSLPKSEVDDLRIPLVVQGFKVTDTNRVLDKIDQLEGLLRLGLGSIPDAAPFGEGLDRVEDARGTRLAWTLDSEMVPWELFSDSNSIDPDVMEKIEDLLDGRQMCITIGLLDQYVIFALSESAEDVSNLSAEDSLLTHDDMKPVKDLSSKVITGVSYVSDTYTAISFHSSLDGFFSKNSRAILAEIEKKVEGDLLEKLEKLPEDLAWLDETIGAFVPEFKGQTAITYLTDLGSESIVYNRTEDVVFDALQPLPILNHVGKDPIAFLSLRLQDHPEYFAASRKIVQKMKGYIEAYLASEYADEDQRTKGTFLMENGWPLLTQLADIWEQKFLPAIKDGQHAFVLQSGNLENKQWWKDMPPSSKPLPLPEMATVTGLSSKDGMIDAYSELFAWFDRVVDVVRKVDPDSIPSGYQIPRPTESTTSNGTRFVYPIPDDCPVPKSMAPQALFTDRFMISSFSDLQVQSLSTLQKMNITNPLLSSEAPKASAAYIHVGKLSQLALPWIVYGIETQFGSMDSVVSPEEGPMPEIKAQDLVDLWKTLGSLGELASSTVAGDERGTVIKAQFTMPLRKTRK